MVEWFIVVVCFYVRAMYISSCFAVGSIDWIIVSIVGFIAYIKEQKPNFIYDKRKSPEVVDGKI